MPLASVTTFGLARGGPEDVTDHQQHHRGASGTRDLPDYRRCTRVGAGLLELQQVLGENLSCETSLS